MPATELQANGARRALSPWAAWAASAAPAPATKA